MIIDTTDLRRKLKEHFKSLIDGASNELTAGVYRQAYLKDLVIVSEAERLAEYFPGDGGGVKEEGTQ